VRFGGHGGREGEESEELLTGRGEMEGWTWEIAEGGHGGL
jgi:hypothetical protein